jgi:hypothetical protein
MKSMKLTLLIFLLLNISKKPLAQNDSAFYNNFLNAYKIQAKPPLNNYYIVLTNTAASVFSLKNSNFISMLSSFSKTYNISEKEALEKIFYDTFNKFLRSLFGFHRKIFIRKIRTFLNLFIFQFVHVFLEKRIRLIKCKT